MANKTRFFIAEGRIKNFFNTNKKKAFTAPELTGILEQNRIAWNLPAYMNGSKFIDKLLNSKIVEFRTFSFSGYLPNKDLYIVPDAGVFEVATSLINKSYLSHYTAVYLHGLTTQIPKIIYISFEQSKKKNVERRLEQSSIDSAFSKPQRESGTTTEYGDYTFLIHNGMFSNRLGVFALDNLPVTNIERTLIDIAVRPSYCGGVDSVLEVYKKAKDSISINKLNATLDKLNFIYPYHQIIGFYLERAGFEEKKLESLSQKEKVYDFYLTYNMIEKEYDKNWKIYYPKGI